MSVQHARVSCDSQDFMLQNISKFLMLINYLKSNL